MVVKVVRDVAVPVVAARVPTQQQAKQDVIRGCVSVIGGRAKEAAMGSFASRGHAARWVGGCLGDPCHGLAWR
jgi:hypothetical protein